MIQSKVFELFIKNPSEEFYLRELARILKMHPMTVRRYLQQLVKKNILIKTREKNRILYRSNDDSLLYKYLKIAYNLEFIEKRKVVGTILDAMPSTSAIVLYGSYAIGENDEKSDVDIAIIGREKKEVNRLLSKKIGKEVNVLIFTQKQWKDNSVKNRALYLDIITQGIALYGVIPVIE